MLDFSFEQQLIAQGYSLVAGVDEVGRGPWAGPVVAAAVVLNPADLPLGAMDSKKLTAKKREALFPMIMEKAAVSIAEASVAEIDSLNIREATFLAMRRALEGLPQHPNFAVIDGNAVPKGLNMPAQAVVQGDGKVLSVACASIVAKVYRDRLMAELAEQFPAYGWAQNAGYGTKIHQVGLAEAGVCVHHRRSFAPVKTLLAQMQTQRI